MNSAAATNKLCHYCYCEVWKLFNLEWKYNGQLRGIEKTDEKTVAWKWIMCECMSLQIWSENCYVSERVKIGSFPIS